MPAAAVLVFLGLWPVVRASDALLHFRGTLEESAGSALRGEGIGARATRRLYWESEIVPLKFAHVDVTSQRVGALLAALLAPAAIDLLSALVHKQM